MEFKRRLEITDLQQQTVSTRHNNVREVVAAQIGVLESFLTGSYSRSTMIAPLNEADIDIFVVLEPSYWEEGGQAKLLDNVRNVLLKTYTKTPRISRNGQAVTITFTDFLVDVVPGFYRKDGGYLIADTIAGKWLATDPKQHVKIMSDANATHNGDLVPLVKMIKCWNRNINHYFRSFHLEVMSLQILHGITISDFPSGARFFFDKGRSYVTQKNPDPTGFNDDVGSYLNSQPKINDAVSRFTTAYNRAIKAEEFANNGQTEEAVNEWRKIFGNKFPAYG